jgi:hypothetical protein
LVSRKSNLGLRSTRVCVAEELDSKLVVHLWLSWAYTRIERRGQARSSTTMPEVRAL